MHQLTKRLSRKIGLMGPTEEFQSETVKTKTIFLTMQALYTLVTSLPALVLYYRWVGRTPCIIESLFEINLF